MNRPTWMKWMPWLLVSLVALGGCASATIGEVGVADEPLAPYGVISPAQAITVIDGLRGQEDFVLLDIRTAEEVAAFHLPGAENLDFYAPSFREDLAALDDGTTYLIYCRTGNRTGQASQMMHELGLERVYDLGGGISAWMADGKPICVGELTVEHACTGLPRGFGT